MSAYHVHKLFSVFGGFLHFGKFADTLFGCFQFLFLGGVPVSVPVLVLLNQELHKPGFMLCRIAGNFSQIGEYTSSQEVSADKVCCTVSCSFLVAAADITVLLVGRLLGLEVYQTARILPVF